MMADRIQREREHVQHMKGRRTIRRSFHVLFCSQRSRELTVIVEVYVIKCEELVVHGLIMLTNIMPENEQNEQGLLDQIKQS